MGDESCSQKRGQADGSPQEKAECKQGAVGAAGTRHILTGDSRQGFPEEAFELGLGERVSYALQAGE